MQGLIKPPAQNTGLMEPLRKRDGGRHRMTQYRAPLTRASVRCPDRPAMPHARLAERGGRASARDSGFGSSMSARQRSRSTERAGRHAQPPFRAAAHRQRRGRGRPTGPVRRVCGITRSPRISSIQNGEVSISGRLLAIDVRRCRM